MKFLGPSLVLTNSMFPEDRLSEVMVLQQHCGGSTLCVFRELLPPNSKRSYHQSVEVPEVFKAKSLRPSFTDSNSLLIPSKMDILQELELVVDFLQGFQTCSPLSTFSPYEKFISSFLLSVH